MTFRFHCSLTKDSKFQAVWVWGFLMQYSMRQEAAQQDLWRWANETTAFWNAWTERQQAFDDQVWVTYVQSQRDKQILNTFGITPGTVNVNHGNALDAYTKWGSLGWLSPAAQKKGSMAANGVNVLTGEFYVDDTDLALPGPMPLQIRRNYSSLNQTDNQFGFGWKINYMPYLTISTDTNVIFAAEPDGAVLGYQREGTSDRWLVQAGVNPHLDNRSRQGIGGKANKFRSRIEREQTNSTPYYKLFSPDGSLRVFQVMTFANTFTNTADRTRPYLVRWQDNRGNYYRFRYGTNSLQPEYGQVRRVESSNGSFLGFAYDFYGHIIEAYTGDGRRLRYDYDGFGDLQKVILPDASEIAYEYEHKEMSSLTGTNTVKRTNSTHLLTKVIKPQGRMLVNAYDNQRRATNQWATVGPDLNLAQSASFVYSNDFKVTNDYRTTISGYTLAVDALNQTTRYDYAAGLISSITNALQQAVMLDWFGAGETNKAGYYRRSLENRLRGESPQCDDCGRDRCQRPHRDLFHRQRRADGPELAVSGHGQDRIHLASL